MNEKRHTIAVFGATGGVGLEIVRQALSDGHRVRALVRDPSKLKSELPLDSETNQRLHLQPGDALNIEHARRAIRGADAVMVALGAPALSKSRIRSEGTASVTEAMNLEGVQRIVAVSVFGAFETRKHLPFFLKYLVFPLYLARAVADHERQERVLARSGLRWTAVRPPNLVDSQQLEVIHGLNNIKNLSMTISRRAVARFMLDQIDRSEYIHATPSISFPSSPTATPSALTAQ